MMTKMQIIWARQPDQFLEPPRRRLFLAGPTLRDRSPADMPSWREEAIDILRAVDFDGLVYVPEDEGWGSFPVEDSDAWEEQVSWEWRSLDAADAVLFWVPRELKQLPGFTTNVEFGMEVATRPQRLTLGFPEGAPKMRYLARLARARNVPVNHTLFGTVDAALRKLAFHRVETANRVWHAGKWHDTL